MKTYPATLDISPGQNVVVDGHRGTVVRVVDLKTVLVSDYETGKVNSFYISDVKPVSSLPINSPDLEVVSEDALKIAEKRYEAIKPLVDLPGRTKDIVGSRASELGVDVVTLYRWISTYENSRLLTSLVDTRRADRGKTRLNEAVEEIIKEAFETEYLTPQKKKISKVYDRVKEKCVEVGLKCPHINTVRNRLKKISHQKVVARRQGRKEAEDKYSEIRGHFPDATFPLAVIQIDHTPLDVIVVDDVHRLAVSRPWITLAIDVFSRMVVGFYVALEKPCTTSVGMCICNSILKKDDWLSKIGIETDWPCYGLPRTVHADNAKEFRGNTPTRACLQYKIDLEWRPVARPEFGAHVERLLGTFADEIHTLPGTTFSNIQERGNYNSEEKAVFTFAEFEKWLTTYITGVYHQRVHSELDMNPIEKYKRGILGTDTEPGTGLPVIIMDEEKLRLDFMPLIERTVQRYGIAIDNVNYWHDVLRPWINCPDSNNAKVKRKFIFRRDPRDISQIWFFDPQIERYCSIPYRNTSHPPISIWELREVERRLKESGRKNFDEQQIFEAYAQMRQMVEEAEGKTKAARRANQRRRLNIGAPSKIIKNKPESYESDSGQVEFLDFDDVKPFDEIEYMDDV